MPHKPPTQSMTEAEWLASKDPEQLLGRLQNLNRGTTDRKLRLFAVACARAVQHLTDDLIVTRAVLETVERYADGLASDAKLASVGELTLKLDWVSATDSARDSARSAVWASSRASVWASVWSSLYESARALAWEWVFASARDFLARMVRDVFGNPFRRTFADCICDGSGYLTWTEDEPSQGHKERRPCELCLGPLLRWNDSTVPRIAESIYGERRFEDLPILADALIDAGCENQDILQHCRGLERCGECLGAGRVQDNAADGGSPGRKTGCRACGGAGWLPMGCAHVRGCWVLDLLLGRE